ncbi:WD40-repeat-containing domain protein [Trametes punicea]|nr:WD40-repeat-containing domain protein [Trametes punicea]
MALRYEEYARLERAGHVGGVSAIAFSPFGTYIATAGIDDCIVYIWHVDGHKLLHTLKFSSAILCFQWFPDSEHGLLFGTRGGLISSATLGPKLLSSKGFWAHRYPIEHLAMHGHYLASGANCEVVVWRRRPDIGNWDHVCDLRPPPKSSLNEDSEVLVTSIQWIKSGPRSSLLVVAYMFHGVSVYDGVSWEPLRSIPVPGLIGHASVSPDGAHIVISNMVSGFDMYDLATQATVRSFRHDSIDGIRTVPVTFVHGGHAIFGGSTVGKATLWNADNGRRHQTFTLGREFVHFSQQSCTLMPFLIALEPVRYKLTIKS